MQKYLISANYFYEPLVQNEELIKLIDRLAEGGFDIALYTGHTRDEVPSEIVSKQYLKTGNFIQELKTTIKPFVGSENQIFEEVSKDETTK